MSEEQQWCVCSVRRLKERRYPGSPRGQCPGRLDGPACSLHHTGPYHIPLCASWPPGLRGWQAPTPHWRRGSVSVPSSEAPIPLRHRPQRPALATSSKSNDSPGCCSISHAHPKGQRFGSSVPSVPKCTGALPRGSRAAVLRGAGVHGLGPRSLPAAGISPGLSRGHRPPDDIPPRLPAHCAAFSLILRPSRLWLRPENAWPEPLL